MGPAGGGPGSASERSHAVGVDWVGNGGPMAVWLPFAIQGGEALIFGLAAMLASHQSGVDWGTALQVGIAAAIGKGVPTQLVGSKKA